MRNRAERRKLRQKKIRRKKKIVKEVYGFPYYHEDGKYSKGKIHCSCPMCSAKTNTAGIFGTYGRFKKKYTNRDRREYIRAKQDILDWQEEDYVETNFYGADPK